MISAGYIITAVSDYAKKTGVSDYLIGFLVVSIGTSLPELTTAVVASFAKAGQIVVGNVIGANIIDVTVVLGVTAIVGRNIFVHGKILTKTIFTVMIMAFLPLLVGFDGTITKLEGVFLVIAFFVYVYSLLKKEGQFGHMKKQLEWKDIWQDMVVISLSIVALLLSTHWLLISSIKIATILEVPNFVMGLILVAAGTTIPELTVEVRSILKGATGLAFGDILGSVVANSTLVLGIGAIINPIVFEKTRFINSAFFMITAVYIALLFIKKKHITWREGIGVLLLYVTFLITEGLAGFI